MRKKSIVVMEWNGEKGKEKKIELVGKGVVLDKGGI